MEAAKRSEGYTVPQELQTRVGQHAQAIENVATEEMRKKPPQLEDVQSTRRKLGEMLRHGESEILEGSHKEILVAGERRHRGPQKIYHGLGSPHIKWPGRFLGLQLHSLP